MEYHDCKEIITYDQTLDSGKDKNIANVPQRTSLLQKQQLSLLPGMRKRKASGRRISCIAWRSGAAGAGKRRDQYPETVIAPFRERYPEIARYGENNNTHS